MYIYYISGSIIPSRSANSIHVTNICNEIFNKKINFKLFAATKKIIFKNSFDKINYYYNTNFSNKNLILIFYPFNRLIEPFIFILSLTHIIYDLIKNKKPDLIITRNLFAAYLYSFFKLNIIYETHIPETGLRLFFQKKIFKSNLKKIVITKNLKNYFINKFELQDTSNIHILSDAARHFNHNKYESNILKIKENLIKNSLSKNTFFCGYFGHLYPGSGIEKIVYLAKKNKDIDFYIFGGDKELILKYKNKNRIINNLFFFGFVEPSKIYIYMSAMNILLLPYEDKIFLKNNKTDKSNWMSPLKLFEYMSVNIPILSSNLEVFKGILNQHNSYLAQSNKLNDWDSKIKYIKNNMDIAKENSENAHRDFLNNFTWKKRLEKIIELI